MLSKIMSIDQSNYPEMLGHTCIINAPSVFKMIWVAIKGFIDPKTQEKIEVGLLVRTPTSLGSAPSFFAVAVVNSCCPRAYCAMTATGVPKGPHQGAAGVGGCGQPAGVPRRHLQSHSAG